MAPPRDAHARRLSPTALLLSASLPALACAPRRRSGRAGDFPDEFDFGVGLSAFEVNPGRPRIPRSCARTGGLTGTTG